MNFTTCKIIIGYEIVSEENFLQNIVDMNTQSNKSKRLARANISVRRREMSSNRFITRLCISGEEADSWENQLDTWKLRKIPVSFLEAPQLCSEQIKPDRAFKKLKWNICFRSCGKHLRGLFPPNYKSVFGNYLNLSGEWTPDRMSLA